MEVVLQSKDSFDLDGFCQMGIVMSKIINSKTIWAGWIPEYVADSNSRFSEV